MRPMLPLSVRILNKVRVPNDEGACWLWTGALRNGYGVVGAGRREDGVIYVHRWMCQWHYGAIPSGADVCHTCHNRRCVRPTHLVAGTRAENMQQSQEAGRLRRPYRPWSVARRAAYEQSANRRN
jgi:hypothetical protein